MRKLLAIFLLILSFPAMNNAAPPKSELESMYDKAFREFDAAHYSAALKELDAIDARQPELAESLNLRGVVLMRQGEYDRAEQALRKALTIEPKFWNARFNLAEIPFLKKSWAEARNRFEALEATKGAEMQGETSQLIQYKILLTFVLQDGKENAVNSILNKFKLLKDSPALYYSTAAIALRHGNEKEAKEWMAAAEKHFSTPLNKLYAESLYEIGWKQKPADEARPTVEIPSTAEPAAAPMNAEARANFEKAERAFQRRDLDGALKLVDLVDASAPNQAESYNLRAEILMEQKKLDEAEIALGKALEVSPRFREAQYNLAQIPFKQKNYAKARERLEALFGETPGDEKNQAAQLIKFKIFLTLLLDGKDVPAQQLMEQFKFTGDTPALYYAQAAWDFQHGNADGGNAWISSARKIYSPALNIVFADSFYDLGWLDKPTAETPPITNALAQVTASAPGGPTPMMRFGETGSLRSPPAVEDAAANPTATPSATLEEALTGAAEEDASGNPAAPMIETAPMNPPTAPGETGMTPVVAASSPTSTLAPSATPAGTAVASQKPQEKAGPIAAAKSANSVISAAPSPVATPRSDEWPQPTFADIVHRASNPRALLVGALLLAGVLLLVWLVVQQVRRNLPGVPLYGSQAPLTEPPFTAHDPAAGGEHKISRRLLPIGPPKCSLQLKASERSGAAARSAAAMADLAIKNEKAAAEEEAVPLTEPAVSFRDQEEVSLAAAPPSEGPICTETKKGAPAMETRASMSGAALPETADLENETPAAESTPADTTSIEEPMLEAEESIAQGQPIPQLSAALPTEPIMPELTQPDSEPGPIHSNPETAAAAAIAGSDAAQSSVETPTFAPKIITTETEPIPPQPTTPVIMPETTITPIAPDFRASPAAAVQQPPRGMQTAVQLTFSLEIASMQLTPAFKMSGLQLKPASKIVTMRLAAPQQPQPPANLQVTFEIAKIQLAGATIGTIHLAPSAQERPATVSSPSLSISGLELMGGAGTAPVQITPSHQEQASVQLTGAFQITAIEFSPLFEITALVLNATSNNVSLQLPGSGANSNDGAPAFEIEKVQLAGNNELGMIQVNPIGASSHRA